MEETQIVEGYPEQCNNQDLQFLINGPQAKFEEAKMSAKVCDPKDITSYPVMTILLKLDIF